MFRYTAFCAAQKCSWLGACIVKRCSLDVSDILGLSWLFLCINCVCAMTKQEKENSIWLKQRLVFVTTDSLERGNALIGIFFYPHETLFTQTPQLRRLWRINNALISSPVNQPFFPIIDRIAVTLHINYTLLLGFIWFDMGTACSARIDYRWLLSAPEMRVGINEYSWTSPWYF